MRASQLSGALLWRLSRGEEGTLMVLMRRGRTGARWLARALVGLALLPAAAPPDTYAQTADALHRATLAGDDELRALGPSVDVGRSDLAVHPLRSLVSPDFADLEFLRPLLRGKRVVQIGESGHGMAETNRLKVRLVRYLHEELGFRVLALESDLYQCQDADRRTAGAPARTTLLRCALGVWHTDEVLPLFEHIRRSRPSPEPLRLAGFDIQPIGTNKDHRPAFLRRVVAVVDSAYADRVFALDSTFLQEYARGSSARRTYFRANRAGLLRSYDDLAAFLAANGAALERRVGDDALIARQTAFGIAAYIRQQTAPDLRAYAETRDSAMAANVRFLADRLFPGEKIIVWAHNYHVRYANADIPAQEAIFPGVPARSMGSWLRHRFRDSVYTIGVYAFAGDAVNNSREPYEIPLPPPGSLEDRIAAAGWPLAFVDLAAALRSPHGAWVARPVSARFGGQTEQRLVPIAQYDALILIGTVTRPTFLH